MTASLLQACDYYFQTSSNRALEQLHDTLTTGFTGNAATKRGEAYEDYVNKVLAEDGKFKLDIEQEAFEELRGTQRTGCTEELRQGHRTLPYLH